METSFLTELTMNFHLTARARCDRKKTVIYNKRGMIEDLDIIENDSLRLTSLNATYKNKMVIKIGKV